MRRSSLAVLWVVVAIFSSTCKKPTPPEAPPETPVEAVEPLHIVSFPVSRALAGESWKYRAALSKTGEAQWTLPAAPGGASVDAAGTVSWTPSASQAGKQTLTVRADLGGESVEQTFAVEVAQLTVQATQVMDPANPNGGQVSVDAPLSPIVGTAVAIPPGSLPGDAPVNITIAAVTNAPVPVSATLSGVDAAALRPVELGPSGLTFEKPVTLFLPVSDAVLAKGAPEVQTYNYSSGAWEKVPVLSVDAANHLVVAQVSHFSTYVATPSVPTLNVQVSTGGTATACASALFVRAPLLPGFATIPASAVNGYGGAAATAADVLATLPEGQALQVYVRLTAQTTDGSATESAWLLASAARTAAMPGFKVSVVSNTHAASFLAIPAEVASTDPELTAWLDNSRTVALFSSLGAGAAAGVTVTAEASLYLVAAAGATQPPMLVSNALGSDTKTQLLPQHLDGYDSDCDGAPDAYDPLPNGDPPPVITTTPPSPARVVVGSPLTFSAQSAEAGLAYSFSATDPSLTLSPSADGRSVSATASLPGTYRVQVTAARGATTTTAAWDLVAEPASIPNTPPTVSIAASSLVVRAGDLVSLTAVGVDSEQAPAALTYRWSTPLAGMLAATTGPATQLSWATPGDYVVTCVANDGLADSAPATVTVSILSALTNRAPGAPSVTPMSVSLQHAPGAAVSVTLHASAIDPDGEAVTYDFSPGAFNPAGATLAVTGADAAFSTTADGVYTFYVTALDPNAAVSPWTMVHVLVLPTLPPAPVDADGDGYPAGTDCNDADPTIHPGAPEICGDGIDQNCDGHDLAIADCDQDHDLFSTNQGDCDDTNPAIYPGAIEVCDQIDNNCNTGIDEGFSVGVPCFGGVGACRAAGATDCNATGTATVCVAPVLLPHPEVCDGIDNDCNGLVDDTDGGVNDVHNCGGCGIACPAGATCQGGTCVGAVDAGPAPCGPVNCAGCCAGQVCAPGNAPSACGFGGWACTACASGRTCVTGLCVGGPDGGTCSAGLTACVGGCFNLLSDNTHCGGCSTACGPGTTCQGAACTPVGVVDAGPGCGPANCSGCCTATGCQAGGSTFACGTGGATCAACAAGKACYGGVCGGGADGGLNDGGFTCSTPMVACGVGCTDVSRDPANCGACGASCPAGQPICQVGTCTTGGGSDGGAVVDGGLACGPGTCPGCCDATGACRMGTPNGSCAQGGKACNSCALFDVCVGEVCQPGASDGGASCPTGFTACGPGCFDLIHDTNNCGSCGNLCPAAATCQGGACVGGALDGGGPGCGPANCATGCCAGSTCMPGFSDAACGFAGMACTSCTPGNACGGGVCQAASGDGGTGCVAPQMTCGATCVNPSFDSANCGGCGVACAAGTTCQGGLCSAPSVDGGVATTCGPGNCAGCCTGNICRRGVGSNCGLGGLACTPCGTGMACVSGGFCVPTGSDAGTTCLAGWSACGSNCFDFAVDPANCGGCGIACDVGATCAAGRCIGGTADAGPSTCGPANCMGCCAGSACLGNSSDLSCGGGGVACSACSSPATCFNNGCQAPLPDGGFVCPAGQTQCGMSCPNLMNNGANCGACGNACAAGTTCQAGVCAVPPVDGGAPACGPANCATGCCLGATCMPGVGQAACGFGGVACADCGAAGAGCVGGLCQAGTSDGGPTCFAPRYFCGAVCVDPSSDPSNCGGCGVVCGVGTSCQAGACKPFSTDGGGPGCGPANCPGCCLGNTCYPGGGIAACGWGGSTCAACSPGNTCSGGGCWPASDGGTGCPAPMAQCGAVCSDLNSDPANCGACGATCPVGTSCQARACVGMPDGGPLGCGPANCAGCCIGSTCYPGNVETACGSGGTSCGMCPGGMVCTGSGCWLAAGDGGGGCVAPQMMCGALCINPSFDPGNCGGCGISCPAATTCQGGVCSASSVDGGAVATTCGPGNCAGCCTGNICRRGVGGNCGMGGVACAVCGTGMACVSGGFCVPAGSDAGTSCVAGWSACGSNCFDFAADPANCGGCGIACGAGATCSAGRCVGGTSDAGPSTCGPGNCMGCCAGSACLGNSSDLSCGGGGVACQACVGPAACFNNSCQAPLPDGGFVCPAGQTQCGMSCPNLMNNGANCGACGNACAAGTTCQAGVCATPPADAGAPSCGPANCAGCCMGNVCYPGNVETACGGGGSLCGTCPAGAMCSGGSCWPVGGDGGMSCPLPRTTCGAVCVDLAYDSANCNACGNVCPPGQPSCQTGVCVAIGGSDGGTTCPVPMTQCGAVCVDRNSNSANCGACGYVCPPALPLCQAGACVASGGTSDGGMTCPAPMTQCGAACVDRNSNSANCGACGYVCPPALPMCQAGACVASGGADGGAPACGPANCLGCCAGDVCQPGNVETNCGTSGMACGTCLPPMMCAGGGCH